MFGMTQTLQQRVALLSIQTFIAQRFYSLSIGQQDRGMAQQLSLLLANRFHHSSAWLHNHELQLLLPITARVESWTPVPSMHSLRCV